MAKKTSSVSFRIDTEIKNEAEKLFAQLGLNMTTAFNVFLRQSIREGRIPFEITTNIPNAVTTAALLEAGQIQVIDVSVIDVGSVTGLKSTRQVWTTQFKKDYKLGNVGGYQR